MGEGPRLGAGNRFNPRLPLGRLHQHVNVHLAPVRCGVNRARVFVRPHHRPTRAGDRAHGLLKGHRRGVVRIELVDIALLANRRHQPGTLGEEQGATHSRENPCQAHTKSFLFYGW